MNRLDFGSGLVALTCLETVTDHDCCCWIKVDLLAHNVQKRLVRFAYDRRLEVFASAE